MLRYRVLAMLLATPLSVWAATTDGGFDINNPPPLNPPVTPPVTTFVVFQFTGKVTSLSGDTSSLGVGTNAPVQGSIRYDASQSFIQAPPSGMSVVLGGTEIISEDYNSFQVLNDSFGVDNINGYFKPISVGGIVTTQNSSMIFGLTDSSASVFTNTALPDHLNSSDFDQRYGVIYLNFTDPNGGVIGFSIDTISTVPLPTALWLFGSAIGLAGVAFRRHRTRGP